MALSRTIRVKEAYRLDTADGLVVLYFSKNKQTKQMQIHMDAPEAVKILRIPRPEKEPEPCPSPPPPSTPPSPPSPSPDTSSTSSSSWSSIEAYAPTPSPLGRRLAITPQKIWRHAYFAAIRAGLTSPYQMAQRIRKSVMTDFSMGDRVRLVNPFYYGQEQTSDETGRVLNPAYQDRILVRWRLVDFTPNT